MKHNENDLKIKAYFEITDPATGKSIKRELLTDLSKLKPVEEKKA